MQNIDDLIRSLERDDEKPSDLPKNSIEDDIKREQLRSISQGIDERKLYARYTYGFLCVYMALVFLVFVLVWLVVVRLYVKRYCSCGFNNHHHRQCHKYIRLCGAILVPFKAEIR